MKFHPLGADMFLAERLFAICERAQKKRTKSSHIVIREIVVHVKYNSNIMK